MAAVFAIGRLLLTLTAAVDRRGKAQLAGGGTALAPPLPVADARASGQLVGGAETVPSFVSPGPAGRRRRAALRAHLSVPLFRNAYSLMINSALTSLLGVAFWILAARLLPADELGRDSALIATMVTLLTICQLNLGNALPRFLPQVSDPARTVRMAYGASVGLALVAAGIFVVVASRFSGPLSMLGDVRLAAAFVVGTALWGVFALQDGALTGMRQAPWVPIENAVFGTLKLLALPLALVVGLSHGAFVAWIGPMALMLIPVNALLFLRIIPQHKRREAARGVRPPGIARRPLMRFLIQDYMATTLAIGAVAVLPLLVLTLVGSEQNAYFYIALTIVLAFEAFATNAGTSLMVESAIDPERLPSMARMVVRRMLLVMLPLATLLFVAAPFVLAPFGSEYASGGTTLLRLLAVALVFRTFIALFQAISRSQTRGRTLLAIDVTLFSLIIGLTVVLAPRFGLEGVGIAWLVASVVVAVGCAPTFVRFLRGGEARGGVVTRRPARPGLTTILREPGAPRVPLPDDGALPAPAAPPSSRAIGPVAVAASLLAIVLMSLDLDWGVWSALVFAVLFAVAPGAALLPLMGARHDGRGWGLTIAVGLSVSTLIAQTMVWLGWHPVKMAYGVAIACPAIMLVTWAVRGSRRDPWSRTGAMRSSKRTRATGARGPQPRIDGRAVRHAAVIAVAFAAWGVGLATTDLGDIAGYGLITALGPAWFAGPALLLAGFLVAVSRPRLSPTTLAAYVLGFVVMLHATTPILYDVPRYTWTYKHIGVTQYIIANGAVDGSVDVYNNWPGFFALTAWLSSASEVGPLAYAAWSQVTFSIVAVAVLLFVLRGLAIGERTRWTAIWLFVGADWIGQNYFAPQALAFVLAIAVLGLVLRCAPARAVKATPRPRPGRRRRRGPLTRLRDADRRRVAERPPPPLSGRGALFAGALCFGAIAVSHQLSPVILILQVSALALVTGLRWWVPAAMVVANLVWISTAWSFIGGRFVLVEFNPVAQPDAGVPDQIGLPGVTEMAQASRLLLALILGLAAVGVYRAIRARLDVTPSVLVASAVAVLGLQSYGGEGILRTYLFALPWAAVLIVHALAAPAPRPGRPRPRLQPAIAVGVIGLIGALGIANYFGQELRTRVTASDVAAETWYEQNVEGDAVRALFSPNLPQSLTDQYIPREILPDPDPSLATLPQFAGRPLGPESVEPLRQVLLAEEATARYVILTPSQEAFTRLYGVFPPGAMRRLADALEASPQFWTLYARDGSWIFQLIESSRGQVGNTAPAAAPEPATRSPAARRVTSPRRPAARGAR